MIKSRVVPALFLVTATACTPAADLTLRTVPGEADPAGRAYTEEVRLLASTKDLDIRGNGSLLFQANMEPVTWTLTDKSPDASSLRQFEFPDGTEICLKSGKEKACHTLSRNVVGVWVAEYKGKSHLIHLTI